MKSVHSLCALTGSAGALVALALAFGGSGPKAEAAGPVPVGAIASTTPARVAGYGTIKGRLVYGGSEAPAKPAVDTKTNNPEFCKTVSIVDRSLDVDSKTKGIAHAFVYLPSPKGKNADAEKALVAKEAKVQIDNKNCEFIPYSTALHKAQAIEFTSSDPVGHNAHYTGFTNNKNVVVPPKGKVTEKLQSEKRPIALKCDIHPWMKGWIMVFDHPFFAVTGEDGSFEITGVPEGAQNVVVWQEKAGYVTEGAAKGKSVTVKAGATVDMGDITLDPAKVKK